MSVALDHCIMESFEEEIFEGITEELNGEILDRYLLESDEADMKSSVRYKLFIEGLD